MLPTFKCFNQILNLLVAGTQASVQRDWRDLKSLPRLWIATGVQAVTEQVVHCAFERTAGAPHLLLDKAGNIVVDGKSGSHIMMLRDKTS